MTKQLILKNFLYGFLSWLIPFAASIPFFTKNGELLVSQDLFKSLMIVIGSISGCFLLYLYFKLVNSSFVMQGFLVGIVWFVINIVLDYFVLIPMMKTDFKSYFIAIGLHYLVITAISILIGYLLHAKTIKYNF